MCAFKGPGTWSGEGSGRDERQLPVGPFLAGDPIFPFNLQRVVAGHGWMQEQIVPLGGAHGEGVGEQVRPGIWMHAGGDRKTEARLIPPSRRLTPGKESGALPVAFAGALSLDMSFLQESGTPAHCRQG